MSDNWQPGDLALCVRKPKRVSIAVGGIYTVAAVSGFTDDLGELGLRLVGVPLPPDPFHYPFIAASRFRKINPLNEAERDAALRELNTPVREDA